MFYMGKILIHATLKTVKTHKIDTYFKKCHELKIIKVICSLNHQHRNLSTT